MTYAPFWTSNKFYYKRPPANCVAARYAWDQLLLDGPIVSMRLIEGLWMCERADGKLDSIDHSHDYTREGLKTFHTSAPSRASPSGE